MPYANWTYKARNPIQRLSHKRRFEKSAKLLTQLIPEGGSLLDFGCADGFLLSKLQSRLPDSIVLNGYEPYPDSKVDDSLVIFNDAEQLEGRKYDVVSCFEVLEHFSKKNGAALIENMRKMLNSDGKLVISVPVEGGPVGLFKGLTRKLLDSRLSYQYTWRNLWRTLCFKPLDEWRQADGYLDHIGFYFRDLLPLLEKDFVLQKLYYSPMPFPGQLFNSQIYAVFSLK